MQEVGVIEVTAKVGMLIWSWQQALVYSPIVEIDGTPHKLEWGKQQSFEVPPGRHRVTIFARPHIRPLVGEARKTMRTFEGSADVTVEANKLTKVSYSLFNASIPGSTNAIAVERGMPLPAAGAATAGEPLHDHARSGTDLAGSLGESPTVPVGATCTNCGASLPQGARFCQECGTPVSAAPVARTCPSCGNQQDAGKFCANCGAQMSA